MSRTIVLVLARQFIRPWLAAGTCRQTRNRKGRPVEFIAKDDIVSLSNPGVTSRQLLSPKSSTSRRVTITEVHVECGAIQPRHRHDTSEQIWYALSGASRLLLADDRELPFSAGDVVRFEDGDTHGLRNDGDGEFVYLSVTAPPIDFGYAYAQSSDTRKTH